MKALTVINIIIIRVFCPKADFRNLYCSFTRCGSFPSLSAPHSLFSLLTNLKRSEKIPGAPTRRWGEWIWLTGPSGLHRNSPQGLNISFARVFDQIRDPEIPITLRPHIYTYIYIYIYIIERERDMEIGEGDWVTERERECVRSRGRFKEREREREWVSEWVSELEKEREMGKESETLYRVLNKKSNILGGGSTHQNKKKKV